MVSAKPYGTLVNGKCSLCQEAGDRSKVYMSPHGVCTEIGPARITYDEDGTEQPRETRNQRTSWGECSNGHMVKQVEKIP